MKNYKKMLLAAGAVAMLASCSEDQTEFNIDSVPGRAKISGTIVYNEGTTIENGRFVYNYKPLASHEVILTVPNSYYKSGSKGNKTFIANTDAEGRYTFDIPATDSQGNASVSIRPFEGTTTTIKVIDNKPKTVQEPVVWRVSETVPFSARDLRIVNMTCGYNSSYEVPESYAYTMVVKIQIGENMEYKEPVTPRYGSNNTTIIGYNPAEIKKLWQPSANVDFTMQVGNTEASINMFGTTDAMGVCQLNVPVANIPDVFVVNITPISKSGSFTHYVETTVEKTLTSGSKVKVRDYEARTLKGYFASNGCVTFNSVEYPLASIIKQFNCKSLLFSPYAGEQSADDTPLYDASSWSTGSLWLADYLEQQANAK